MHTVQIKTTIKAQISGIMACIGISDVVTASVYLEKTCLKKLMMIMIMNKSKEMMVFHGCQICYETKARKAKVDFKFDTLYRYVYIESLLNLGE